MRSTPRAVRTGRRRIHADSPDSHYAALGFGTLTAIAALLTGACAYPFGDENTAPRQFEVLVANGTDQPIYFTSTQPDVTEPSGRFSAIRAGEERAIGIGVAAVGDEPGGCFDDHLWLFRTLSDQEYRQGTDISDHLDDVEIVGHFPAGDCTDEEQIVVEYDGPANGGDAPGVEADGAAPEDTGGQPRGADPATELDRRRQAVELQFGDSVEVDGVAVVIGGVVRVEEGAATDDGSTVYLMVRAENRSESTKALPGLEVGCLRGSAVAVPSAGDPGSTYKPQTDLPAGEHAEGTLAVGVRAGCQSPVVWPAASGAAFWSLPGSVVQEPADQLAHETAEQLAHELIDNLDVSDDFKTCMHEVVAEFQLSEEDAQEFEDLDAVADKAEQGDERAVQIMLDFQTALAACN